MSQNDLRQMRSKRNFASIITWLRGFEEGLNQAKMAELMYMGM